jgi:hypothetical protein
MNRRTAHLLVGLLVIVCVGLVASVLYPVSTSTPHASLPVDERFSMGEREPFSVRAELVVDDETALAIDGTVTDGGPRYSRLEESGIVRETYRTGPNGTAYLRTTVPDDVAPERRASFETDERYTIHSETSSADGTVFVVETTEPTPVVDDLSGASSVILNSLYVTAYERTGRGDEAVVYEPQAGWFDEATAYRISDPSGTVRVDGERGTLESASVSWDLTQRADTYAHDRLQRLFGEQPHRYEIEYVREESAPAVDPPAWVPSNSTAG